MVDYIYLVVGYSSGYPSRFEDDGFLIGSGLVDSEVGEEPQSICALLLADVAIGHGWEFWAIGVSLSFLPLSSLLLDVVIHVFSNFSFPS